MEFSFVYLFYTALGFNLIFKYFTSLDIGFFFFNTSRVQMYIQQTRWISNLRIFSPIAKSFCVQVPKINRNFFIIYVTLYQLINIY